jgi:hypothetical protein
MAVSELAPPPVAFYAVFFFLVNATYVSLIWELMERTPLKEVSPNERRIMRFRSIYFMRFRGGCGRDVEISADWTRNVLLLPDRSPETRSARSREATIPVIWAHPARTSFAPETTSTKGDERDRVGTAGHPVSRARDIADRAYVLDQGGVIYHAAAHELLADNDIKERYCSV